MNRTIPYVVIPGMTYVSDAWMSSWNVFYQDIFHSFVYLNNLFRNSPQPEDAVPQQNLWASKYNKSLNIPLINAGYIEVGDLTIANGSIDYKILQDASCQQGSK